MIFKTLKSWLQTIGVLFAIFVFWLFVAERDMRLLAPPPSATNLETFAVEMPEPTRLSRIDDAGATKIIWIGDTAYWAIPSGPSCYVFDTNGHLIEWNPTTGDKEPTTRYLRAAWNAEPLTVDQAIAIAKHGADSAGQKRREKGTGSIDEES